MSSLFRKEALENKQQRLWGDVVLIQPFSFYLLTGAVTSLVLIVGAFLVYGTYARRENVSGYLLPDKGVVKMYATNPGIITEINVVEGDKVEKGDLLLSISTKKNNNESSDTDELILHKLEEDKETVKLKLSEQKLLDKREEKQFKDQVSGLAREVRQLRRLIKTHKEKFRISQKQLDRLKMLQAKNFLNKTDYITAYEHHVDIGLRLDETRQQLSAKNNLLLEAKNLLSQLPLKASLKRAEYNQQLIDIEQRMVEIKGRRIYTLRSPSSGHVTALQVSPGERVRDKPLLTILPDDAHFKAELFIPTRAIGFIKVGQPVLLRYSAFPYQRFGLHKGTIEKVTEVILTPEELNVPVKLEEPVYRVSVTPEKQSVSAYGKSFPLQAGMLLDASIILEGRSLGEWLLAPIYSLRGRL
jgi:membrane fusion protein